jgi:hypothetical protein
MRSRNTLDCTGVIDHERREKGVDDPGRDCVHADAELRKIERSGLHDRHRHRLRSVAGKRATLRLKGIYRRGDRDRAPRSRSHHGPGGLVSEVYRAVEVDLHDALPLLIGKFREGHDLSDPGDVDGNVEMTEALDRKFDGSDDVRTPADISDDSFDAPAGSFDALQCAVHGVWLDVEEHHVRGLADDPLRNRSAQFLGLLL